MLVFHVNFQLILPQYKHSVLNFAYVSDDDETLATQRKS